ncbi:MAG TPA: nitrite/sulfite reductase, partial [Candidatus Binatia bacterium]|nr:nitrite/sulfite reductase [Candidatus Binatia bacterium]
MASWKDRLSAEIATDLAREIDVYETQIELKKQGKVDDKLFAETRLRRGAYGQRYDNGQRHDGVAAQKLSYPTDLLKGPETLWDAPGMQRIKIPFGGVTPRQLEVLADLAEEYSDEILHVTTRQDVQLHFIHIEDTPAIMRRLAAVGITTREACGNSVRNVTACPIAGVCRDETFDVTPYSQAMMKFLLGHPDTQDFGRKFKIAFSGCKENACALTTLHDLGFIARKRVVGGVEKRGFETYVGGGLGAVPYTAKLYDEFVPEEEIMPLAQAISRVFARLGEKKNRARARAKFLVAKLGLEEFRRLVEEERKILPHDDRWTSFLEDVHGYRETPLKAGEPLAAGVNGDKKGDGFATWRSTNVYTQRQGGYAAATVTLPLGDMTSAQARALADVARRYVGESLRTTVDQNIMLRWVRESDLPALYRDLTAIGLGAAGAGTIVDVTACPGTDTCKLGIASSRGLAGELSRRLGEQAMQLDAAVNGLHIKVSGCFNSCGQHHIADLGFYGVSRKVGGTTVPHFQVVLGGKWEENAGSYGLAIGAIPSKRVPEFVTAITDRYVKQRKNSEKFLEFVERVGKKDLKQLVDEFSKVPPYAEDRTLYSDWRDPREFTLTDLGVGECAGEVISRIDFDLQEAERQAFEAQLALDDGHYEEADKLAYTAMLEAARGLVRTQFYDCPSEADAVVEEFRKRFYDTQLFFDRFVGGKFAHFFFSRHDTRDARDYTQESAHHTVEEAMLFIEAAHACHGRMLEQGASGVVA